MTVYSGPVFDMAVNQFGVIANHLEITMDERDRILMPKRAITDNEVVRSLEPLGTLPEGPDGMGQSLLLGQAAH